MSKRKNSAQFAAYLQMVGRDYALSGSHFTAADYRQAAKRILSLEKRLKALKAGGAR